MRVNGFKCDTCEKLHNQFLTTGNLPPGWFSLTRGNTIIGRTLLGDNEQHFCSLHCLQDWVDKQTIVANEEVSPDKLELWKEVKIVRAEMIEVDRDEVNEYWRDL